MAKIKTVLLTGATGFIGSHLAESLIKDGYKVIATRKESSSTWRVDSLGSKIDFCGADRAELERVFKNNKIDCVMHLATSYKKIHKDAEDVEKMVDGNILFPSLLLELSRKHSVGYFINTGTFVEYRLGEDKTLTENSPIEPHNLYAATKISFENILKHYSRIYGIKGVTLKLFSPYGEKDNEKLVVYLVKNLLSGAKVELTPGEQRWNFTYVADIVDAYLKTLDYIENTKSGYEVFNIGSDEVRSIKELVGILEKVSGKSLSVDWGAKPYSPNETMFVSCDNSKARELLRWTSKVELEEGLKRVYSYYINNKIQSKLNN